MPKCRDEVDQRILDAALARILQVGIRRSSLDDIARRSGINRVTIYRRFSGKDKLIEAVLERETERMLTEVGSILTDAEDIDERIEQTVLYVLRQTRMHRLVRQLLDVAPEEALTFYTVHGGEMVALGIGYIADLLDRAQHARLIARYDSEPIAEMIARLAHSLMLTPKGGVDFTVDEATHHFVRTTIVPMVKYGIATSSKEITR
ncbi:TetR/AcrR family transcriptional regulator [Nocardia macrotermitis]|uniref:HTH tetR-type domain-containing protein n=1 Tax=Nocardia macrotermitis TaxID=2585198 RepID=A0A7K0DAC2_9NOCA|nr:TetR/AcrR family transcriptional regulator [Nocardia macrotermitis]MQY21834.1 hypothetical protein [Nocardia macrotermitis]